MADFKTQHTEKECNKIINTGVSGTVCEGN
ncbi:hypothetical protein ABID22_001284 [Pontibacter aydingkolensis]